MNWKITVFMLFIPVLGMVGLIALLVDVLVARIRGEQDILETAKSNQET